MSNAQLMLEKEGVAGLSGTLNFSTTPDVWFQLKPLLQQGKIKQISLAGVDSSNSVALAMLIEAMTLSRRSGEPLEIVDLPDGLKDLANMSNVLALLEAV